MRRRDRRRTWRDGRPRSCSASRCCSTPVLAHARAAASSSSRVDQRRAVAVQEPDEADLALLRVAGGERSACARWNWRRSVSSLRLAAWITLLCSVCSSCCILPSVDADGALERRVDLRHRLRPARPSARRSACATVGQRLLDGRRQLALEQFVQRLSRPARCSASSGRPYFDEEPQRGRVDQRGRGALVHQRHRQRRSARRRRAAGRGTPARSARPRNRWSGRRVLHDGRSSTLGLKRSGCCVGFGRQLRPASTWRSPPTRRWPSTVLDGVAARRPGGTATMPSVVRRAPARDSPRSTARRRPSPRAARSCPARRSP